VALNPESACLDHDTLAALIAGQLLLDDHPRVEAHLAECSLCQHVVAAAAAGLESTQGADAGEGEGFPKPGDVLAGKYTLERVLGKGGMGTVFAARHGELGQLVAIKVLHSSASSASARFLREARISAGLLSEHTARVFDLGRTSAGAPFLVMEHLEGEDLSRVVRRGPLPPSLALDYALQICDALAEAHAAGVVHRDLKPSNVFVTRRADGSPCLKVLDYGISKRLAAPGTEESHSLTERHSLLGSPAYMSPEQLRQSKDVDARADIWSMGVLLYELLTGSRPFKAPVLSALSVSIAADVPPPPSSVNAAVPPAFEHAIMRCLSKDPHGRFASAAELAAELRGPAPPQRAGRFRQRVAITIGACALAAAALRWGSPRSGLELSRNEAAMLPGPAKPSSPGPPRLNVHCDQPLAPGSVRFSSKPGIIGAHSDRVWPLRELCESSGSGRSELAFEITRLLPLSAVVLEPAHPFYSVELESSRSELSLNVHRKQRAAVQLWLEGAGCERVESLEWTGDGLPPRQIRLGARRVTRLGQACTHRIELPFEAFGKTLQLRLRPGDLTTPSLVFDGAVLRAPLQQRPRPRPASVDGPCIPPRYCRD
jgi:serine/threonine protein kinase